MLLLPPMQAMKEVIIVEGEMDKLSLNEVGWYNVVSVPNGAVSRPQPLQQPPHTSSSRSWSSGSSSGGYNSSSSGNWSSGKLAFLGHATELLHGCERIVLALDGDAPGEATAQILAEGLGRGRCWRVMWSREAGGKDANEVLMAKGATGLRQHLPRYTVPYAV
jgi:twinkle protein